MVAPTSLISYPMDWAVLGVELKKPSAFNAQAVRQAQAEFLIFGLRSQLPFVQVFSSCKALSFWWVFSDCKVNRLQLIQRIVQLVTDLNRGGVAYYLKGKTETGKWILEERCVCVCA